MGAGSPSRRASLSAVVPQPICRGPAERRPFVADRADHSVWRLGPGAPTRERIAGTGALSTEHPRPGLGRRHARRRSGRLGALLAHTRPACSSRWPAHISCSRCPFGSANSTSSPVRVQRRLRDGAGTAGCTRAADRTVRGRPAATFVADCESSAVRRMGEPGDVSTVVGTGLFDFGDRDGVGDDVLLQHCLDVAWIGRRSRGGRHVQRPPQARRSHDVDECSLAGRGR